MNNFAYESKTKVFFGKGCAHDKLPSLLSAYGDTVMLAYGRRSAKENGIYNEICGIHLRQGAGRCGACKV